MLNKIQFTLPLTFISLHTVFLFSFRALYIPSRILLFRSHAYTRTCIFQVFVSSIFLIVILSDWTMIFFCWPSADRLNFLIKNELTCLPSNLQGLCCLKLFSFIVFVGESPFRLAIVSPRSLN